MATLIAPDDTWTLWAVIFVGVAVSIWLEQTYSWAAKLSGPLLAMCLAIALSNAYIMPPQSKVYDVVQDFLAPLAMPLLLFRANLMQILRTTRGMFLAFQFASLGTIVGALLATAAVGQYMKSPAEVAGVMTASYIGGGVNFYAVANTYRLEGNLTGPLMVADNFIMAGVLMGLLLICGSRWARRWYPHPHSADAVDSRQLAAEHWRRKEISLLDIAASLAIAVAILACAKATSRLSAEALGSSPLAQVFGNLFVHITVLSTLVATLAHRQLSSLHGAEELGSLLLFAFLFVIGLPAQLMEVVFNVPIMFVFCFIMAAANMLITFGLGRLFRLNLEDCALAVNASIGGPTTAAAMAVSMGWSRLVLPGLLIGLWGYMVGTALGLMVGEMARHWLVTSAG